MIKFSDNPPSLSPNAEHLRDISGRWWVGHTRARFEKAFAFDLLARGIAYFLPMTARTITSGGRERITLIPLFPSYVFFCGGRDERNVAIRTGRLAHVLDVMDQEQLIAELSSLHRAIAGNARLAMCPPVASGQRYRVVEGPFEGLEGTVVRSEEDSVRIVMEVSLLGQAAAMEIDGRLLEPSTDGTAVLEGKGSPC